MEDSLLLGEFPQACQGTKAMNIITLGDENSGAILSECMRYRYALWRNCNMFFGEGDCVWIGLNPSTADHQDLDATTRRCLKWSREWGCKRYVMLNAYAFRSRHPKVMFAADDPVGPENDATVKSFTARAKIIIAAWGTNCDDLRAAAVCRAVGRPMECLGLNQGGTPKHPLFVKGETTRVLFQGEVMQHEHSRP